MVMVEITYQLSHTIVTMFAEVQNFLIKRIIPLMKFLKVLSFTLRYAVGGFTLHLNQHSSKILVNTSTEVSLVDNCIGGKPEVSRNRCSSNVHIYKERGRGCLSLIYNIAVEFDLLSTIGRYSHHCRHCNEEWRLPRKLVCGVSRCC